MNANEADPNLPDTSAAPDTDGAAAPEKPKRRRAPRKAALEAAPVSSTAEHFEAPTAEDLFGRKPQAVQEDVQVAREAVSEPPARASSEPATDRSPAEAGDGQAADAAAGGLAEGAGADGAPSGSRRNRNRRRGKRGADRQREGGPDVPGAEGGGTPRQRDGQGLSAIEAVAPAAAELFAQVLSGEFDVEPDVSAGEAAVVEEGSTPADDEAVAAEPVETAEAGQGVTAPDEADTTSADAPAAAPRPEGPAKRVLAPDVDAPKLHKVLAQSGVASRRDLEQMITDGRVTVNGAVAHTGQRVSFGDRVNIDGKQVRYRIAPPPARVLAYHKPAGEVVSHDDPQQRPTVFRRLPRLPQGKWQSVGRLDINTEGLLLFTTSGELANQLMHPRFGVEREYAVRSLGVLGQEAQARLLEGVDIEGQRCGFKSIEDGGGEGVNHWYRCVITEGRNREVRKLFEAVGHAVSRLIRIRYGSVVLPRGLKRGVWVDLDEHDLRNLKRLASGPRTEPRADRPDGRPEGRPEGGRPEGEREGERRGGRNNRRGKRRNEDGDRGPRPDAGPPQGGMRADRPPRPERPPRQDRGDIGNRQPRPPRAERGEAGEGSAIPNPLQQTFDKRAIQQARAQRRELPEDGPIPNPLQQTYDKRALQQARTPQRDIPEDGPIPNPLQQTYDKRFAQNGGGGGGFGGPRGNAGGGQKRGRGGKQGGGDPNHIPDPMQTSVGYIGANALHRKGGGGGGGRGGPRRGGTGGGGGGGGGGPRGGGQGNRGPRR